MLRHPFPLRDQPYDRVARLWVPQHPVTCSSVSLRSNWGEGSPLCPFRTCLAWPHQPKNPSGSCCLTSFWGSTHRKTPREVSPRDLPSPDLLKDVAFLNLFFFFEIYFHFVLMGVLTECLCTMCVPGDGDQNKKGLWPYSYDYGWLQTDMRCWKLNLGPLRDQWVPLTFESFLQNPEVVVVTGKTCF